MRSFTTAIGILLFMGRVAAADTNHCEVTVTGEATASFRGDAPSDVTQGKIAAVTDYWMSESQLRTAISALTGLGTKMTPAEHQQKVDEAMKKDPRFMLLIINCITDDGGIILGVSSPSKYADIPFKPAAYVIAGDASKPGQLTAMFHTGSASKRISYRVSEPGQVTLTQFDRKGIAGTFTLKAESRGKDTKHVTVAGSFHYSCHGEACQK